MYTTPGCTRSVTRQVKDVCPARLLMLTGSPSLIDSQKEYYMEDALLITISKEFDEEEKEYVLVIDKEI